MEIKISKIKEKDIEKAYQFCLSIFDEFKWDKRFTYGLENLKEFFNEPREIFLVAKKDGKIIACGGLKRLSNEEALLKRFYVAKDFRGTGLADLMLKEIKKFAKKKNYKSIIIDIFQDNLRAKRFFQKRSFLVFNPSPQKEWPETKYPDKFEYRKLIL